MLVVLVNIQIIFEWLTKEHFDLKISNKPLKIV